MSNNDMLLPSIDDENGINVVLYAVNELDQDREVDVVPATELENSLAEADQAGVFTPAAGMGQILGVFNNNIFAEIIIEENGTRYFQFVQRLKSGGFTERCRVPQELMMTALPLDFNVRNANDSVDRDQINTLKKLMKAEYYGKNEPTDLIQYESILRVLAAYSSSLPITDLRINRLTPKAFYVKLREKIATEMAWIEEYSKEEYFLLIDEQIEQLADVMGMNRNTLLKTLAEYKFLHITDSTEGLKTKVHTKYKETRFYCIKKLESYRPRKADDIPNIGNVPGILIADSSNN